MKKYEVAGHEPSFLPDQDEFKLVWNDEFDGTELNRDNWQFRTSMMGQRWPSWTESEKALYLDGQSNVVFKLIKDETDGHLCCAHLQTGSNAFDEPNASGNSDQGDAMTQQKDNMRWRVGKLKPQKHLFKYGYYECRCKLQQKDGWWSAFWMQSPSIGTTLDAKSSGSEVDIMESFKPNTMQWNNVFSAGYGVDCRRTKLGPARRPIDGSVWHRFGLLWEEDKYTFFVDGEKTYETSEDVSQIPEFLLISTEVYGYRKEGRAPIPESYDAVGDEFKVDYVRVFQKEK